MQSLINLHAGETKIGNSYSLDAFHQNLKE